MVTDDKRRDNRFGMKIERKWLTAFSLAYIYIPVFLFLLGWVRLLFALLTITVCILCLYRFWKQNNDIKDGAISVDWLVVIFAVLFFVWIGYYAGYGRFVDQASDWQKHNAVLSDLVQREWPVLYSNSGEKSLLTYYIGQYVVPAIVGKVLHSVRVAEIMLYVWNIIGLILVYLNICVFAKAESFLKQFTYALMLPFFSIPLWISELCMKSLSGINSLGEGHWFYNYDGILIQYSSNYTLLRWVFPQVIPIWLIILVFLLNKDKIHFYVFMLLPSILFGTLTFIGLFPLAIAAAFESIFRGKRTKKWLYGLFSPENILMSFSLGTIFFFYFLGNVVSDKPAEIGFSIMPYTRDTIVVYFCFVIVNILFYALILYKRNKKDWIYYTCCITLILLPLFKMGKSNDLTMRASIPALFIFMIYIIRNLFEDIEDHRIQSSYSIKLSVLVTIIFLFVGMYYPFVELTESVQYEWYSTLGSGNEWETLELFSNRSLEDVNDDLKYNYYSYDIETNFFCKYLMRRD